MWPPSPSAPRTSLSTATILWSTEELHALGRALESPAARTLNEVFLRQLGFDPERADELATTYRLGGASALAQVLEAAREKP